MSNEQKNVYSILVVDDDLRIRELLGLFLSNHDYKVKLAANAAEARACIAIQKFDLYIFDIMMPGKENGLDLAKNLHTQMGAPPIILLTAKDTLDDKVIGLEEGADDYIVKPFEPLELLARIKVLLRRSNASHKNDVAFPKMHFGDIVFDCQTARLWDANNQEIPLTSTEQILLKILAQNPFNSFSRHDLCNKAGFIVSQRTVDVQVTRLRKKLKDTLKQSKYIKTMRHVGYALYPDSIQ
jgi:two-component system phosphate regulon response regulator OmpR